MKPLRPAALTIDVEPGTVTVTHPPADELVMTAKEATGVASELIEAAAEAEGCRRLQEDEARQRSKLPTSRA
jgi:hypothetical protein